MKTLCTILATVIVLGHTVAAFATSQFSNSITDVINEKNANLSGNVNDPPETAVGGDVIGNCTVISALPFADAGNTCGFTNDYDEACPYTDSTSPDVVYCYMPSSTEEVTFDLCNSGYDTKIYVYENAAGNLIACNDDACNDPAGNSYRSIVSCVRLIAGNTYYVVVDGYYGDCGSYNLSAFLGTGCTGVCDPEYCPPGTLREGEPVCGTNYVDAFNGGCNSIPNVFTDVSCFGGTVCGTGGTYSFNGLSYRDTDWYAINFESSGANVTVTMCASFDAQLAVIDGNAGCGFITIICGAVFGPAGWTLSCTYTAPAGDSWIFAATSAFSGVPCGSPYTLDISTNCEPAATEITTWGGIKSLYR